MNGNSRITFENNRGTCIKIITQTYLNYNLYFGNYILSLQIDFNQLWNEQLALPSSLPASVFVAYLSKKLSSLITKTLRMEEVGDKLFCFPQIMERPVSVSYIAA